MIKRTLYVANDGQSGPVLYISDGTKAGTVAILDLPGATDPQIYNYASLGNLVLFSANNATQGAELWVTDGTPEGTRLLKDIYVGAQGSSPFYFTQIGSKILFWAQDAANGRELWSTDGTDAGTVLVKDLTAGSGSTSVGSKFSLLGTKLLFEANDQMWVTDGTSAGTVQLTTTLSGGGLYNDPFMLGTKALFSAFSANGNELWVTDGTAAGTSLLKDIEVGSGSSYPSNFFKFGTKALFTATTAALGTELYVTDGTVAGTFLLKDIYTGTSGSYANSFTILGSKVLFVANNGTNAEELWVTDGTSAGTVLLKDISPGAGSSVASYLTVAGSKVVFAASDGTNGIELWATDGTAAGTAMLKNINTAVSGSSEPKGFVQFGSKVLFTAYEPGVGVEPWVTDGTAAGTFRLKDLQTNDDSSWSDLSSYTIVGGKAFFFTQDYAGAWDLWVTDGTSAGTVLLGDFAMTAGSNSMPVPTLTVMDGKVLFKADDGVQGPELWISDGTVAGTTQVDLNDYSDISSNPRAGAQLGNLFLFTATFGTATELWATDGTPGGSVRLVERMYGQQSSGNLVGALVPGTNKMLFEAETTAAGRELWITDGTVAGTQLLKDMVPGAGSSGISGFKAFGSELFFLQRDFSAGQFVSNLWKSDGTAAGTVMIKANVGSQIIEFGSKLVFAATDAATGTELWISDGTQAGTVLLKDTVAGAGSGSPTNLTLFGDKIAFLTPGSPGANLWVTDGTTAGTTLIKSFPIYPSGSQPLRVVGNKLVFDASNASNNYELWSSDGTTGGTVLLKTFVYNNTNSSVLASSAILGQKIIFGASDGVTGKELWVSDGTVAGTVLLKDINVGSGSSSPVDFLTIGDKVLFRAANGSQSALWVTDGTTAGTVQLAAFSNALSTFGTANWAIVVDGKIYFAGTTSSAGSELWVSDGTVAGTRMLLDISAGSGSGYYTNGIAFKGKFYFSATDASGGQELWVTDGTTAGTVRFADINPGQGASNPYGYFIIGDKLYFNANNGIVGQETWVTDGTAAGTKLVVNTNTIGTGSSPSSLFVFDYAPNLYNKVPGAQSGMEDANLLFSAASGNGLRVTDPGVTMTVSLSVTSGTLTLSTMPGLTIVAGANGSASMTLSGSGAAINAALDDLIYRGGLNFHGADVLTITSSYSNKSDTDTVAITLAPDGKITGSSGNDLFGGTDGNDFFDLFQGGDDTASGGDGTDIFYFGSAFNAADQVDGGAGANDTLVLQGNYNVTLGASSIAGLEGISLQSGGVTKWGDTANNFYDYALTTADGNVAAGQQFRINAQSLRAGEDFTFDGSAETNGRFLIYAGFGTDHLTGGAGNDIFFFENGRFGVSDTVVGGAGIDAVVITGSISAVIGAGRFTSIEALSFNARFASEPEATPSYEITLANGNIAAGATLIVNASSLVAGQTLTFNGSAETLGRFTIYGGGGDDTLVGGANGDFIYAAGGADVLTGGAGIDTFQYRDVNDSTPGAADTINDFESGIDKIDFAQIDAVAAGGGDDAFTWIGSAAFSNMAGELRADYDSDSGAWTVQGDVNGDGIADLQLVVHSTTLNSGDFLL